MKEKKLVRPIKIIKKANIGIKAEPAVKSQSGELKKRLDNGLEVASKREAAKLLFKS